LKEHIGKPIFVRSAHSARLTDAGEIPVHYARSIPHLTDEAFANLSIPRPTIPRPKDVVHIDAPDDYAAILLPDILLLFNKAFPQVQVEVVATTASTWCARRATGALTSPA
jgi:DNA-binding transcriptional LysR family regulator